jgi:hypothetical protein
MRGARLFVLLCGVAAGTASLAQSAPSQAVVTFILDFPRSEPSHYSIAVEENGHAKYETTVKDDQSGEPEIYKYEFEISSASRDQIFQRAKQAKFFADKIDSGNSKIAFSGEKTLSYQDGPRSFTARYNYSSLEPVRELTTLFQTMAGTLEYGRKLAYFHKYQKLALDDEIKKMELQARNHEISEIQSVAPVLQGIVADASVINGVRARAKALLGMNSSSGR